MSFEAYLVDQETAIETDLPSFVSLQSNAQDSNTVEILFDETTQLDIGEYKIIVYSELSNFYHNRTSVQFQIVVFEVPDFNWTLQPLMQLKVENQEVTVGDQLAIYRPPYSVIANGWQLNLLVNLGRAEKFVRFNEESVVRIGRSTCRIALDAHSARSATIEKKSDH